MLGLWILTELFQQAGNPRDTLVFYVHVDATTLEQFYGFRETDLHLPTIDNHAATVSEQLIPARVSVQTLTDPGPPQAGRLKRRVG